MWFAVSHLDSHSHLQIFVMFCQVPDPIPCSHAEMHIMVIYVLVSLFLPFCYGHLFPREGDTYIIGFPLRRCTDIFVLQEGWELGDRLSSRVLSSGTDRSWGVWTFPSFLYPCPLLTLVAHSKHCVFVLLEWGSRSANLGRNCPYVISALKRFKVWSDGVSAKEIP